MAAAWLGVAVAACYDPHPPAGLPCSPAHQCPDGQVCDLTTDTCGPPTAEAVWRDDTAADFAAAGAVVEDAVVEAPGAVAPRPYLTGALRTTGFAHALFTRVDQASWAAVAAGTPVGRGFLRGNGFDLGSGRPLGVHLDVGDDVTVAFEGEIYLEAGSWQFSLDASDLGFLELDSGSGFAPLIATDDTATGFGSREVPRDGWYPIRGAVAETAGLMWLYIAAGGPDPGTDPGWLSAERFRAPVDDLTGVVRDGFDDTYLLYPTASTLTTTPLAAMTFDDDLAIGDGSWSQRYAGQVRIDVGGSYVLHVDSYAGDRLWIDGEMVIDHLGYDPASDDTPPLDLDPGWHDVVIEQMWDSAMAPKLALTVASGPELAGQGFPVERTRPVAGRGNRWGSATCGWIDVPDNGSTSCNAWLDTPGGQVLSVDAQWEVEHPVLASVSIDLRHPDGFSETLVAAGDLSGAGTDSDHFAPDLSHDALGQWRLTVTDHTADMMTGRLNGLALAVTYRGGGEPPFPTVARYTSAVRDLGDVTSFGAMTWAVRQGAPTQAQVRLRAGATAEACAAAAWTDITAGAPVPVAPARFAQYQVELHGDGDVPTALDWIQLAYAYR